MEDKELIRRIQNGQKDYLNEIAGKYYDDIYYFCCYQTGNMEDAYDLTQETFLRFIRYVDRYRYRNLKGYLLTIAMNLCRNYYHDFGRTRLEQEYIEGCEWTGKYERIGGKEDSIGSSAEVMAAFEDGRVLAEAFLQLPDMQREAVLLHHFYGYKNREIARMTGCSYAAVKSRIKQGLKKLQGLLDKEDFYG